MQFSLQFAKVFSCQNFPLYGSCRWIPQQAMMYGINSDLFQQMDYIEKQLDIDVTSDISQNLR